MGCLDIQVDETQLEHRLVGLREAAIKIKKLDLDLNQRMVKENRKAQRKR